MGCETKTMVEIRRVTDHDTGMYHMGEIDGLFQEHELDDYIRTYGEHGRQELLCHLAYLQHQVFEAAKRVRSEDDGQCQAGAA